MARIWTEGFEFRNADNSTWQPVGSYDGYNFVANGYTIYVGNTEIPNVYVGNNLLTDYNFYHNPNTSD